MRLEDFRFRLTDTESGESAVMSFADFYGYEGEVNGVLVNYRDGIPAAMQGKEISLNGPGDASHVHPGWEIEVMEPGAANPIVASLRPGELDDEFIDDPATRYIAISLDGRRSKLPASGERTLALNLGGETRNDGYRELGAEHARIIAYFLRKTSHSMPPASRIFIVSGERTFGDEIALAVQKTIAAALLAAFGQNDMPLWDNAEHRVLPDPVSFETLLDALKADLPAAELAKRRHRFEQSRGHVNGLRQ